MTFCSLQFLYLLLMFTCHCFNIYLFKGFVPDPSPSCWDAHGGLLVFIKMRS